MKREIRHLPERDWKPYPTLDGLAADREIAETVRTMNGTGEAFRLIVLRRLNPQPSLFEAERNCYQSVASNRQEGAAEVNWKHNQRGNGENWHKELKSGPRDGADALRAVRGQRVVFLRRACWRTTWASG